MTEDGGAPSRPRVRRGEGEVTSWPRDLVAYVPAGPEDDVPSPDEDRTRNRLALAARLIGVLRAHGADVEAEVRELAAAQGAWAAHDRPEADRRVDRLLARLDERSSSSRPGRPAP